ncbi:hypothetical protein BC938DRAFT_471703 [Jimgerdemannia flammicorona]|uniref:Uncharacterized protein n=1 Tax=Jimgerdemannia flammicorona TaxID=994334 RepID=A0A433QZY0_9FUNG|nr:hypothetical protein BC938DRAFT_471703 [Jimgerdemannia flammicorona]
MLARDLRSQKDQGLRIWNFRDYAELKSIADPRSPPGAQFWDNFEHFVASFRVLKSKMFGDGATVKISQVHAGARLNGDFKFTNHHLELGLSSHQGDTNPASRVGGNVRKYKNHIINYTSSPSVDSFLALDRDVISNECHQDKLYREEHTFLRKSHRTSIVSQLDKVKGIGKARAYSMISDRR